MSHFILSASTIILTEKKSQPIQTAVKILCRDMKDILIGKDASRLFCEYRKQHHLYNTSSFVPCPIPTDQDTAPNDLIGIRYRSMILAPNGIKANLAILKNCLPKGIPTIVMHQRRPRAALPIAIGSPKKIIQMILAIVEIAPPALMISFLKGQKDKDANLKHCLP